MVRDPTDAEVSGFLEFAGLSPSDRPLAISALKQGNYDVNQLVMEYYDDAEAFRRKYSWDESAFSSSRDGTTSDNPQSFHIESTPDYGTPVIQGVPPRHDSPFYGQMAPSRPPTRTKNRSPLSRVIDLTGANVAADDEDEDLKRALRESATEAGLDAPPQESGVMSDWQTPAFGPATREQYDTDQWAMVTTDTAQTNVSPIILPSARKREPNAPAMLINDNNGLDHQLGALLTVLHEIPLARNTLLQLGDESAGYGHNSEWWMGKPILPPEVLASITETGNLDFELSEHHVPLEQEIHRLLAFLDSTDRSYGSSHVLSKCIPGSWVMEQAFFSALSHLAGWDAIAPFVHEYRTFDIGPPGKDHTIEDCNHDRISYFRLSPNEDNRTHVRTLYDIWDYEIWKSSLDDYMYGDLEHQNMNLLDKMGEVVVMGISDPLKTNLEIPPVWYPERYMWSRRKEAIGIQWLRRQLRVKVSKIQEKLEPPGQPALVNRLRMLDAEVKRCDVLIKYLDSSPRFRAFEQSNFDRKQYPNGAADAPCEPTEEEKESLAKVQKTREESIRRCDQIKELVSDLKIQLERCDEAERFISGLLTDPARDRPIPFTCNGYHLRGVAVGRDIVYLCRRSEPALIELDEKEEPQDQWWRLEHCSNSPQPIKTEMVDFDTVQRQVWNESTCLTLIYATEDALNAPRAPLSDALQRFVKGDNRCFQRELEQEEATAAPGPAGPAPTGVTAFQHETVSSYQMRERAGSVDSMATNRASLGSMDSRAGDFDDIDEDLLELGGTGNQMSQDRMLIDLDGTPGAAVLKGVGGGGEGGGNGGRESPILGWSASSEQPATEGGQKAAEGDIEMGDSGEPVQEMKEVSTKPIFMTDPERPPPLPERK